MNFTSAVFEASCGNSAQLPESNLPEICFSGRSNVGKSSLINKILGRKALARVSSVPGKTITVNFYRTDEIRIVDLPGYGYAKITDKEKMRFSALAEHYFGSGRNIKCCFQLVDMRRAATPQDIDMLRFLKHYGIPYALVLTKCDKLNKSEFEKRLAALDGELGDLKPETVIPFSALKGDGTDTVRAAIEKAAG